MNEALPRRARDTTWRAFVLHRYDWSESSLILDLFTREGGRVVAAAKGAKRPSSALRSVLLPFQPLQVQLSRRHADGEDEVLPLRSAEWAGDLADGAATLLRGQTLFLGFYVNELLMKLLARGDPHPALFDAYAHALAALASARGGEGQAQAALRAFELTLLQELGWLADLSVVASTLEPLRSGVGYTLRAEGGLTHDGSDSIDGEHWLRMRAALSDGAYEELQHACEHAAAAPLRTMLRHVLAVHLGHTTLRTRAVALSLRRLARV
jgi:DNA repair protein RecO (recombination protein O)